MAALQRHVVVAGSPEPACRGAVFWQSNVFSARSSSQSIDALPDDALTYLLGSRYCDTQKLSNHAWSRLGHIQGGWARARAICQYVHDRIQFGYQYARDDRTASEGHQERIGVCRDFAHLAIALCRCRSEER